MRRTQRIRDFFYENALYKFTLYLLTYLSLYSCYTVANKTCKLTYDYNSYRTTEPAYVQQYGHRHTHITYTHTKLSDHFITLPHEVKRVPVLRNVSCTGSVQCALNSATYVYSVLGYT